MKVTKREALMLAWHIGSWLFAAAMAIAFVLVLWDRYKPR